MSTERLITELSNWAEVYKYVEKDGFKLESVSDCIRRRRLCSILNYLVHVFLSVSWMNASRVKDESLLQVKNISCSPSSVISLAEVTEILTVFITILNGCFVCSFEWPTVVGDNSLLTTSRRRRSSKETPHLRNLFEDEGKCSANLQTDSCVAWMKIHFAIRVMWTDAGEKKNRLTFEE